MKIRVLVYWVLFIFFAAGALAFPARRQSGPGSLVMISIGAGLLVLAIGLRFHVGADWPAYEGYFKYARRDDFSELLRLGEPGYQFFNWIVQRQGGQIYWVNILSALVFVWGLIRFCRSQDNAWLALLVAVPYLIVVVAMGYTRQAIAIGLLMAGLADFASRGSILRYGAYIAVAALFHQTAALAFPVLALAVNRGKVANLLIVIALGYLFYTLFLVESVERYVENYVEAQYASQGAAVRVGMSSVAAMLFLLFGKRMGFSPQQWLIWRNFSLVTLALLAGLFVVESSTAIDRLALYVIPLQLAVLARVPNLVRPERAGVAFVVVYAIAIQFTWLNYAAHSRFWVPYQVFPI